MSTETTFANNTIVVVGPPNAGKTSLYNALTGSRYKTVNYPGATVEFSTGRVRGSTVLGNVVDTPGIVSLIPRSADERVAVQALSHLRAIGLQEDHPRLVIQVVDATQVQRHLPLLRQVRDAGFPQVVALTMNDIARRKGRPVDANLLSEMLGLPVVEVNGRTGEGVTELVSAAECAPPATEAPRLPEGITDLEIRNAFAWADSVASQCAAPTGFEEPVGLLDRVTLHPVLGLGVFAAIMTGLFWSVFSLAGPFMDWTEGFFGWLGELASTHLPESWLTSLLVDGVIAGGGAVFVFVPQIAILFLALGILEDSGYLARGAMLVDRFLTTIGLNGKSFVPLLSGNACAIPAAMAARTIPGRKERFLTLLVVPLMSCSARLPVWGLLLGFLIPSENALLGGFALTGIYLASLVFASIAALIGGRILRIEPSQEGFQIELPLWRAPTFRTVLVTTWDRTVSYVKRAGLTILLVSIGFWLLMTLPSEENSIMVMLGKLLEPVVAPMGVDWRVGVALIAAFAAREVFVSALAVVFAIEGAEENTSGLLDAMRNATFEGTSQHVFTVSSAIGLIVFFLIALQCLTTVAVMRKETSNRFALGQLFGFVAVAWLLSVLVVQGLRLLGVP